MMSHKRASRRLFAPTPGGTVAFGKTILLVLDGLGDRPIHALGDLTPLEAAHTPSLDALAAMGECGLMHPCGRGVRPGSDVAHLAILGYPPTTYYTGRGPLEAAGIGAEMHAGDVAFRCNFATVEDDVIIDRRAGRISETASLVGALNDIQLEGVTFSVVRGTGHRAALVLHGAGLSGAVSDADSHVEGGRVQEVVATDGTPEAERTACAVNQFMNLAHSILDGHRDNKARRSAGLPPANALLPRGGGVCPSIPSFFERYGLRAACVAGGGLYRGIATLMGMDVVDVAGATGLPNTDAVAKIVGARSALATHDFVFVHIKGADSLGEDGDSRGKTKFIARIDAALEGLVDEAVAGTLVAVTADHSTPCALAAHSADPVPVVFAGSSVRTDSVAAFGERACADGGLGHVSGTDVMPQVMNLIGRQHLYGA